MNRGIILIIIALLISGSPAKAELRSTFDSSKENWRGVGDVKHLKQKATGGNPGGYLSGVDIGTGDNWYFVTPVDWAGDLASYKSITFDLKQSGRGTEFTAPDLIIVGANGKSLIWQADRSPSKNWSHYAVPLGHQTFAVTQKAFDAVMKNVTEIRIRGEFIDGLDTGGLDNVVLSNAPVVVQGTILGVQNYKLICKNLSTQQSITLSNIRKLDWNCEESGLLVNNGDKIQITITGTSIK